MELKIDRQKTLDIITECLKYQKQKLGVEDLTKTNSSFASVYVKNKGENKFVLEMSLYGQTNDYGFIDYLFSYEFKDSKLISITIVFNPDSGVDRLTKKDKLSLQSDLFEEFYKLTKDIRTWTLLDVDLLKVDKILEELGYL